MSDRCKLGDVAVIIKDEIGCEANIGRFVHVEGPRRWSAHRGTVWRITPVNGTTITYVDTDRSVVIGPAVQIEHRDDWLMPVRPGDLDAQARDTGEPIPAKTDLPAFETQ